MEEIFTAHNKEVFDYFKAMNQIPRTSRNEQAISDWLVEFANKHNLEVKQDEALNVIIKKPGTEGYENAETLILQGHMDMVGEKEAGSDHDFDKDPIEFIVDGDMVHANHTTLGADNGIAVAMAMVVLAADNIPHPPLEVLITTDEETGMNGAFELNPEDLQGRKLINLDAEVEGELLTSCAGGISAKVLLPIEWEDNQAGLTKEVEVTGLLGGHSGMEINKQRGNANQLLARVLYDLAGETNFGLVSLNGGSKHNAIPRLATAVITINEENEAKLTEVAERWTKTLRNELHGIDDNVEVKINSVDKAVDKVFTAEVRDKAIAIATITPIGVQNVSFDIEGLVQSSNNLGIVVTEAERITFENTVRSSVRSMKYEIANRIKQLAEVTGADIDLGSEYPEWQYDPNSTLRDVFVKAYEEQYEEAPVITAIHAGLECGVFSEKFDGNIDLIAFGPNIYDAHTPSERVSISSVERTFELLLRVLSHLK